MAGILIVEDNQAFKDSLKNALKEYEIIGEAENGFGAIQLVQNTKPDLVILDLSLPRMSGIAALKKIRSQNQDVKIIVLSMHNDPDYVKACKDAGIDAYVLKDEGRKAIRDAIKKVLAGGKYFSPGTDPDAP